MKSTGLDCAGASSLISGNKMVCGPVEIGNGAALMSGCYLMPETKVLVDKTWRGTPAHKWM